MSELLNGRWAETKEALLEGLQGTKKSQVFDGIPNSWCHFCRQRRNT
jgi:hypothetical protein